MPFAAKKKDEDLNNQAQNISGVSTSFNVPGQQAQKSTSPKASGQYQNIEKYLDANASQAQRMGENVAAGVDKTVDEAKQATADLNAAVPKVETYDPSKALEDVNAANKDEYNNYKSTGGYSGPSDVTGVAGYEESKRARDAAMGKVGQVGTEVGQKELLKQTYNRPSYSAGLQSLDQSLLQRSAGGRQAVESLADKYKALASEFGTSEQGVASEIQAQKDLAAANKAAFAPAEQAAQRAIMDPIEQRVGAANEQSKAFQSMVDDLSDLSLEGATLDSLGLAPGQTIYDLNLSNYINPETQKASVQNIATNEERQKYNQLLDFLGTNAGQLGGGDPTYKGGAFDKERLAKDLAGKNEEYDRASKSYDLSTEDKELSAFKDKTPEGLRKLISGPNPTYRPGSYFGNKITNALKSFDDKFSAKRAIAGGKGRLEPIKKGIRS